MNKYNNIPTDVKNSLIKLKKLIEIIENNLHRPKDSILREITIELNITIEAARKLFSLYYPLEGSLSTYIIERKRAETIKAIMYIDDDKLMKRKIEEISNCSKSYFDRMLYRDYKVKIKNLKNNKNIENYFVKAFDVDELEENISDIYDCLYSLRDKGYIDIKRTKIRIKTSSKNIKLAAMENPWLIFLPKMSEANFNFYQI